MDREAFVKAAIEEISSAMAAEKHVGGSWPSSGWGSGGVASEDISTKALLCYEEMCHDFPIPKPERMSALIQFVSPSFDAPLESWSLPITLRSSLLHGIVYASENAVEPEAQAQSALLAALFFISLPDVILRLPTTTVQRLYAHFEDPVWLPVTTKELIPLPEDQLSRVTCCILEVGLSSAVAVESTAWAVHGLEARLCSLLSRTHRTAFYPSEASPDAAAQARLDACFRLCLHALRDRAIRYPTEASGLLSHTSSLLRPVEGQTTHVDRTATHVIACLAEVAVGEEYLQPGRPREALLLCLSDLLPLLVDRFAVTSVFAGMDVTEAQAEGLLSLLKPYCVCVREMARDSPGKIMTSGIHRSLISIACDVATRPSPPVCWRSVVELLLDCACRCPDIVAYMILVPGIVEFLASDSLIRLSPPAAVALPILLLCEQRRSHALPDAAAEAVGALAARRVSLLSVEEPGTVRLRVISGILTSLQSLLACPLVRDYWEDLLAGPLVSLRILAAAVSEALAVWRTRRDEKWIAEPVFLAGDDVDSLAKQQRSAVADHVEPGEMVRLLEGIQRQLKSMISSRAD